MDLVELGTGKGDEGDCSCHPFKILLLDTNPKYLLVENEHSALSGLQGFDDELPRVTRIVGDAASPWAMNTSCLRH
jgi:hypothetical protein